MDIKRNCALSPFLANNKSTISTSDNPPPSFESNTDSINVLNSISLMNVDAAKESDFLAEQFRLERDIADRSSVKTQDSFITTYSSLRTILSQMQVKLASVFLQETEYLQQREQRLDQDEQTITKRMQQLKTLRIERKQLEKEFSKLQDRLETAVAHVINFQTNGEQILQLLFSESRQIDEALSGLIAESMASLNRCRTMIHEKIDNFSQKSDRIQSELTDREGLTYNTQLSITSLLELVSTLNLLNIEHSQDITMAIIDFEKRHRQFIDVSETTKIHWNIQKEMDDIRLLENEKLHLEKELSEQTILLENIYTILGKTIVN